MFSCSFSCITLHFAPHALHILILVIFMHIRVDHAEPESEFQAEQVQGVFGGPQVSSCEDANIVVIKVSPGTSHPILNFYILINIFMLRMIVH
jgi:hypothetical protein